MSLVSSLLWLLHSAHAGTAECLSCCSSIGVTSCDAQLRVYGDETQVVNNPGGWSLQGLWVIDCSGQTRFDSSLAVYLDHAPRTGEIAMPEVHPRAIGCFISACTLPGDLCASAPDPDGNRTLASCTSGRPADSQAIQQSPSATPAPMRVVIDGQALSVNTVSITPPVVTYTSPPVTAPPVAAPATSPPPASPSGAVPPSPGLSALFNALPPDPPPGCQVASDAARAESRTLVVAGDELRARGDPSAAFARYHAALSIDRCNAYGWLGLGIAARGLDRPDIAARALRDATTVLPAHYGAWTELGKTYEAAGQFGGAADAFRNALAVKPGYQEAVAGLARANQRLAGQ